MVNDPKSSVFGGQEGSGQAQIFDTSGPVRMFHEGLVRKGILEQQDRTRRAQAERERRKKIGAPEVEFWQPFQEDIMASVKEIMSQTADAERLGYDTTDLTTEIGRKMHQARNLVEEQGKQTRRWEEIYKHAEQNFNPNDYDGAWYEYVKSQWQKEGLTYEEARQLPTNFLEQPYDFYGPLADIKVGDMLTKYENTLGVTTTYKNASNNQDLERDLTSSVDNWLVTRQGQEHYKRGVALGQWESPEDHERWVKENVYSEMSKSVETTREASDKWEWNMNASAGFADGKDFRVQYDVQPLENALNNPLGNDVSGPVKPGNREVLSFRMDQGKVFGVLPVNNNGQVVNAVPVEIERINGGAPMLVAAVVPKGKYVEREATPEEAILTGKQTIRELINPDELGQYKTIRVPYDQNKALMKNHLSTGSTSTFDPLAFMDEAAASRPSVDEFADPAPISPSESTPVPTFEDRTREEINTTLTEVQEMVGDLPNVSTMDVDDTKLTLNTTSGTIQYDLNSAADREAVKSYLRLLKTKQ